MRPDAVEQTKQAYRICGSQLQIRANLVLERRHGSRACDGITGSVRDSRPLHVLVHAKEKTKATCTPRRDGERSHDTVRNHSFRLGFFERASNVYLTTTDGICRGGCGEESKQRNGWMDGWMGGKVRCVGVSETWMGPTSVSKFGSRRSVQPKLTGTRGHISK